MKESGWLFALKWTVAFVLSVWLGLPDPVKLMVYLMAINFLTGVIAAVRHKNLDSDIARKGITKAALMFIFTGTVYLVASPLGAPQLGHAVALTYSASKFISIAENCHACGVPIPASVVELLAKLQISETATRKTEEARSMADLIEKKD